VGVQHELVVVEFEIGQWAAGFWEHRRRQACFVIPNS
jgi:hypothetical protein